MANATFSALLTATGTASQVTIGGTSLHPTFAIATNPVLPGTGGFTMPTGTTAQRAGIAGTARFNTSLTQFECTVDGAAWIPLAVGGGGVASVSGTANRITSSGGVNPVIDISAAYVGQNSITTLGTITTGIWNGTNVALNHGGTNAALVADNGGLIYSTAAALAILASTATAHQIPLSGSNAAPTWSTATYPATTTINRLLYSSAANTITDLATANDGTLITSAGGVPSISSTLPTAVQNNITSLNNVTMGGTLTLHADPTSALEAVTKQYADAIAVGINFITACYAASTTALTVVYANGAAGVGATLTNNGAQAAFSVDGVTPPINSRILIKNQASTLQNGVYTLTTVGSGASNWVLTRATDYDTPAEITAGDLVPIENGTINALTSWLETATVVTVGVDPIVFAQFTYGSLVPLANGGTGASLVASNGGIFYSNASTGAILSGTATANQVLLSGSNAAPTWSTATYPTSTTISQLLYSSSNNVITGLATANRAVLTTSTGGAPVLTALATDGQLIIGSTAGAPAAATLTAGGGISIATGSNSITISTTGGGLTWTDVVSATQTLAVSNGYITDRSAGVTYTLPASGTAGDVIRIVGKAGIATIAQNANQKIVYGNQATALGVGGSLVATDAGDCIELICTTSGASTIWTVTSSIGNWNT